MDSRFLAIVLLLVVAFGDARKTQEGNQGRKCSFPRPFPEFNTTCLNGDWEVYDNVIIQGAYWVGPSKNVFIYGDLTMMEGSTLLIEGAKIHVEQAFVMPAGSHLEFRGDADSLGSLIVMGKTSYSGTLAVDVTGASQSIHIELIRWKGEAQGSFATEIFTTEPISCGSLDVQATPTDLLREPGYEFDITFTDDGSCAKGWNPIMEATSDATLAVIFIMVVATILIIGTVIYVIQKIRAKKAMELDQEMQVQFI
eukprot:TRINITY_DN10017_c0_g1_i1.p1 TRINITY_DN10017_c0_g1~~TRINITY_DN10017_c0_g1_i1.p1  ORF type:complete len:254 (-),score=73.97 TRINITY_DN10017_c0_g1_i1:96-857(-)